MSMWLRQSTAYTLKTGPYLDSSDSVTPKTALTIARADVLLSKNGSAFTQKNETSNATHDTGGWYGTPIDTTDTGTLGLLQLSVQKSGALPVWHNYMVLPANVFDSIVAATDYLQADMLQQGGTTLPVGALPAVAAGSTGGLILRGTSAGQIEAVGGSVTITGTPDVNMAQINTSPTAAAKLAFDYGLLAYGEVVTVTSATDFYITGVNISSVDDHYNGCFLDFKSGANLHQARQISLYTGATGRVRFTGTGTSAQRGFEVAPTIGDVFFIRGIAGG